MKKINKSIKRAWGREFKQGLIVTNPKVGLFTYVVETSPKGKSFFKGKVIQGNPLSISQNARTSELNKAYFRRAKKKELEEHRKRFKFPIR